MEYSFIESEIAGKWQHRIELIVNPDRKADLTTFLNEMIGHQLWRLNEVKPKNKFSFKDWCLGRIALHHLDLQTKEHAFRIKLMWEECEEREPEIKLLPTPSPSRSWMYWTAPRSGKTQLATDLMIDKIRDTGRENLKKFETMYLDYESGFFDFESVRAKGDPIRGTKADFVCFDEASDDPSKVETTEKDQPSAPLSEF
jgi:hypothetical protein